MQGRFVKSSKSMPAEEPLSASPASASEAEDSEAETSLFLPDFEEAFADDFEDELDDDFGETLDELEAPVLDLTDFEEAESTTAATMSSIFARLDGGAATTAAKGSSELMRRSAALTGRMNNLGRI